MRIKFLILTLVIMVASLTSVSSYAIIGRVTKGGFLNWYDYTSKTMVDFQWTNNQGGISHMLGWSIKCEGIGSTWCPTKGGITLQTDPNNRGVDITDDNQCELLVNYVQEQFQNNVNSGTYTTFVQVQGEATLRAYTATWSYNATTDEYKTDVGRNDVIL